MLISNKSIPIFFATILFVACSHNTASFTAEDPIEIEKDGCDGVVIPNYSPNIEYLNILDTMFHLGLFDNDTLFIMYDREYQTTDYSHQINGTTIVYLTKEGRVFSQHDSVQHPIKYNRYIEYGYESHCDSHLYICIYECQYDANYEPSGQHAFCEVEILDSILTANHSKN